MQPLQVAEHEPSELQTCPPHVAELVHATHCQGPELQTGLVPLQSELPWHCTQVPSRQIAVGALQLLPERQPTQVPELLHQGVPPEQPVGQ